MRLLTTAAALRCYLNSHRPAGLLTVPAQSAVGFVPTMGALHQGHLSLIKQARQENTTLVVSIFVNPLQFGPAEDFQKYPRTLEQDQLLCEQAGVDVLFAPSAAELFPAQETPASTQQLTDYTTVLPPDAMTRVMCGQTRPGHFSGVATVVVKLLNLVQPTRAYFGQKDAQQVAIIRKLVADLNVPTEIVVCPTLREASGLACSSRNQYLTPEEREQATVLYRALQQGEQVFQRGERTATQVKAAVTSEVERIPTVTLEYVELVDPDSLTPLEVVEESGLLAVAVKLGATRLIDNLILRNRKPIVAIDGPAGAGKSTVTKLVAEALGLLYLDTGAMYRAVTWLVLTTGTPLEDETAIAELVSSCHLELAINATSFTLKMNGQDVTSAIRTPEVTAAVSAVSAQPAVRRFMVQQQQRYGGKGGLVAEGRDIGTNVFPDAELKIFLTASIQERSRRRHLELNAQGRGEVSLEQLERDIALRDEKDSTREISPLRKAADAIEIQTDGLSIAEVTRRIVMLYKERAVGVPEVYSGSV